MSSVGLLYGIDRKEPQRIDARLMEFESRLHRALDLWVRTSRQTQRRVYGSLCTHRAHTPFPIPNFWHVLTVLVDVLLVLDQLVLELLLQINSVIAGLRKAI